MATHLQIQTAIEGFWTTHSAKFTGVQTDFSSGHAGKFWQGIVTPATPPDDGTVASPDLTRRPTDQLERWVDVFTGGRTLPGANWPLAIRVDVYDGPRGKGWSVTVIYTKLGETWSRTFHFGPEVERELGWARVS